MIEPLICNNLSMEEKRELIYAMSNWSDGPDVLQSWSRRELLQILCEEMGKDKKFTGMSKSKIIEQLLKTVSEKKSAKRKNAADPESEHLPTNNSSTVKRPRKSDNPSRLPIEILNNSKEDIDSSKYCQNLACRASLHFDDTFCRRCSCCICFQFDDNKDPGLWLVCNSEPPFEGNSCGMTCHLECALKHEKSGIMKGEHHKGLDGSFICVSCGKVNDLLRCWRKQLVTAKETRRVDVLCYRVSLAQRLLLGSNKYSKLNEIMETTAEKLQADVGPIVGLPGKMARGIVNRLSSGPEVQKLCALAVETLDSMLSYNIPNHLNSKTRDCSSVPPDLVKFENVNSTSVTVVFGSCAISREEIGGFTLWHRKADTLNYPPDATCTLFLPNARFLLSDLSPSTEYIVKVAPLDNARQLGICEVKFTTSDAAESVPNTLRMERDQSATTNSSSLSNPSSGDESINITAHKEQVGNFSGKGSQDMPGDSVSLLDEERATWENGSVHNTRKSSVPTSGELLSDIPKSNGLSPEVQFIKELSTSNDSSGSGKKGMEIVPSESDPIVNPFIITPKTRIGIDRPLNTVKPSEEELYNGCGDTEKETEAGSSTKKKSKAPDGEFTRAELYAEVAEATLSSFLTSNDPLSEPVRIHKGTEKDTEALNKSKEDVDHFQKTEYLAQRGYAVMMYEIGTYYYFGLRSVKRDHERGLSWFLKAAERGEPRSMELLGEIYTRGAGVERNYEKAFEWFTLAANQHYASAYNGIGYLYIKGFGVEMKNYTKAKEYFQKAAENNDSGGHYNLGVLYLKGIGVKKDVRIACQFFIKAANAGQPKAFFQLAKMFHTGTGLKKNVGMATALYKLVAEWGPWSSLSRWALESYLKGEVGKAFLLYSRMAELGYEVAQSNAAWILEEHANHNICLEGSVFCTDTERYQRALALWWQASEQGSGHAALQIGKAYYEGRGTKRDFEQAAESYVHARLQSIAEARFELGLMHKQGHGLPLDLHLAKRYFGEARENEPSKLLVYKIISHLIDIYLLLLCKAIGAKVCIIVGSTAIVCLFTCYYRCRHGHRKRKDGTAVQRALQAIAEKRQQLAAEEQEQMAALMQQQEQMDAKKKRQKLQVQGAAGPKHRHQKH